MVMYTDNIALP